MCSWTVTFNHMMYSVACSPAEDSNLAAAFSMVKRKSVVVPEPHEKALPTGMMRDMMERHHLNSPIPKLKRGRSSSSLQAASPAGSQGLPFQAHTPSPGAKQISIREESKILSAVAKEKMPRSLYCCKTLTLTQMKQVLWRLIFA